MIKKENYVVLFMKLKSLNNHDNYYGLDSQLIILNRRLIESIGYKTP
jgi:hypothetical protein